MATLKERAEKLQREVKQITKQMSKLEVKKHNAIEKLKKFEGERQKFEKEFKWTAMRICIYHRYEYPDLKSRLKTYLLKCFPWSTVVDGTPFFGVLYGGETWINDVDIIIGEDENYVYHLEIQHGEWCRQIQILIIKELKRSE